VLSSTPHASLVQVRHHLLKLHNKWILVCVPVLLYAGCIIILHSELHLYNIYGPDLHLSTIQLNFSVSVVMAIQVLVYI